MIELRWLRFPMGASVHPSGSAIPHTAYALVLQYRDLLSDEAKLGIQSQIDADIAKELEQWRDIPIVEEK